MTMLEIPHDYFIEVRDIFLKRARKLKRGELALYLEVEREVAKMEDKPLFIDLKIVENLITLEK